MKKDRYFRATFMDAANMDSQITIEFKAPFPIDEKLNYAKIARLKFNHLINLEHIKIRDIEPVEV